MTITAARSIIDPVDLVVSDRSASVLAPMLVERVDLAGLERHEAAWTDLAGRAIEPNVFLEPGFALPLLRHIGLSGRQRFLLVWEGQDPTSFGRLLGLFPVVAPRVSGVAHGWAHNQVCSGIPLVDGERMQDVLEALFGRLRRSRGIDTLALRLVTKDNPFFDELRRFCAASSRGFEIVAENPRAVLRNSEGSDARIASFVSAKRRKEHARLSRRLSALGARNYATAHTPAEVADATERFLTLEHAGWKGGRGTSFLADPALADFIRSLTRRLAETGKCRIEAIEIDGRPVAMGVILVTRNTAYFWKTSFDETRATLSPGVQFTLELTKRQLADPSVSSTDSCAVADHPMIDKIWPDRLIVSDLVVAVHPHEMRRFRRSVWFVRLKHDLRQRSRAVWRRLRRLNIL